MRHSRGRVYPHACGGTASSVLRSASASGLSPRLRGNRFLRSPLGLGLGSIPAPAGEPNTRSRRYRRLQVYPRACGGTGLTAQSRAALIGLSPRLRGNRGPTLSHYGGTRSIPAPAGEPNLLQYRLSRQAVYPRACGGTDKKSTTANQYNGLSPRLRGTPPLPPRRGFRPGLSPRLRGNHGARLTPESIGESIPAPAGEPLCRRVARCGGRVYPRACGGTRSSVRTPYFPIGLSPRLRGNLARQPLRSRSGGLSPRLRGNRINSPKPGGAHRSIPAPAGEPNLLQYRLSRQAVYPRACGGTDGVGVPTFMPQGLSPRLRGNLQRESALRFGCGSIPAPAGEPSTTSTIRLGETVYPRACGGTLAKATGVLLVRGLSPRLRGNLVNEAGEFRWYRSIPAPAGEPPLHRYIGYRSL